MADINRTTNSMALPSDISAEILQKTQEESAIMRLARSIELPGRGVTIPVITGDPTAEWVAETGVKPVSNGTPGTKLMKAYKIAVIETFSKEFVRDIPALYDALVQRMPAALGGVFDATVIGATARPDNTYFDNFASCTAQSILNANNGTYLGLVAADADIAGGIPEPGVLYPGPESPVAQSPQYGLPDRRGQYRVPCLWCGGPVPDGLGHGSWRLGTGGVLQKQPLF